MYGTVRVLQAPCTRFSMAHCISSAWLTGLRYGSPTTYGSCIFRPQTSLSRIWRTSCHTRLSMTMNLHLSHPGLIMSEPQHGPNK